MTMPSLEELQQSKAYVKLTDIVTLPYEGKGTRQFDNQALLSLRERDGAASELQQFLEDKGLRRMRIYDRGMNALLGYTTQGQLVRISPIGIELPLGTEAERPDCPRVLGHIQCHKTRENRNGQSWKIEIVNEVAGVTPPKEQAKDLSDLRIFLAKLGLHIWDPKPENIRRLKDGTPIIIDPDTVRKPDAGDEREEGAVRYHASQSPPPYYWGEKSNRSSWKQVREFPQLNPASSVYGKILGVVDKSQLQQLENKLGVNAPLVHALRDEGLYPDQLPQPMKAQLKALMPEAYQTADQAMLTKPGGISP
ncbi:MAG: hypothetical protein K2Q01_05590 [Rickettsiales bacterium]|nr:hypothetical protein [Rickettsiales bacterium]